LGEPRRRESAAKIQVASKIKQQIAVVGAIAYDQISVTPTLFTQSDQPTLNCKLSSFDEDFGGCAGNIAYNLIQLECEPLLVTCSGTQDEQRYLNHCETHGIQTDHVLRVPDAYCARAVIVTDPQGQQFTGFYPGPVPSATQWLAHLRRINFSASQVIIQAPYPPSLMHTSLQHASALTHEPMKIWCPGQYADQLDSDQILAQLGHSDWIVGNAHEIDFLQGNNDALSNKLVIKTDGGNPVEVHYPGTQTTTHNIVTGLFNKDPTGCGDAFLAALAHYVSLNPQRPWQDILPPAIDAAVAAAAACLVETGSQRHRLSTGPKP
jgi:adenosine kinase